MKRKPRSNRRSKSTSDAAAILHRRIYADNPARIASVQQEFLNSRIARAIYDLRTSAGMSQSQLAALLGTHASAISRLEDADYNGHSLSMLRKIAAVFGSRLEIRFVPAAKSQRRLVSPADGSELDLRNLTV